jgi:hypothetical protein
VKSFRGLESCNLVTATIDVSQEVGREENIRKTVYVDVSSADCRPKS